MGWTLHVLLLGLLLPGLQAFKPLLGNSITHREITEIAILRKTIEVCRALAIAEGRDFPLPTGGRLSASIVQRACSPNNGSLWSAVKFKDSIITIYLSNADVDVIYLLSDRHHFRGEEFTGSRALITDGMASIKATVQQGNFISARFTLGKICHTLQDFYSNSNWIELENEHPNTNLIRPDEGIGYIAGEINKDNDGADHGHLHRAAAAMAVEATMELLEDIRGAAGESNFLQY
ncbi:hypothetical protein COCON_G00081980 [Conger conger]|uniref:VWA7 N-terminal domain-containing protein n=1 Tax=Conger conger TaxID=82655 RepID=A0A9Q1DQ02_CONCO|nr:hypothetical protein COCON_G00081980 [Conger conger]